MKQKLEEETILFISIVKWVILSLIVGSLVGLSTALFIITLNEFTLYIHEGWTYYYLLIPVALLASTWFVQKFAPNAKGHGTEKVIEALHKQSGYIAPLVAPIKLIATILTLIFGGSAGKEGPCAQIGAALASSFASLLKLNRQDRKKLVICGISAGFAAVFGTPIAGSLFGVEVLFVGTLLYDVLLPSFIAGITAHQVASKLGVTYFYNPLKQLPPFTENYLFKIIIAGLFFGLCSFCLIESLKFGEKLSERFKINSYYKNMLAGVVLVILALIFSSKYLGLGLTPIEQCLRGKRADFWDFPLKIIFTALTLNFGGSGGIVTPIFFIGSTAGSAFAPWLHMNPATAAAIGMVSVLAGCANAPIAASIMAIELFGPTIAPYASIAAVISFLITGHRSVFPSQILSMKKSSSIDVLLGQEIDDVKTSYHPSEGKILKRWFK
ncbi:MAG: chloride channel protein [Candidatus Aureabacteria bacterium]|nr:chloride channel protein [Candidatus Auribacterota bacterium]